jgi:hypothetical protein
VARVQRIEADPILLEAALEGLEHRRKQIDDQIRNIRSMLGKLPKSAKADNGHGRKPKRELSPEARKRIAAAQKKRWAEFRRKAANS